jgi:hypothetical protein
MKIIRSATFQMTENIGEYLLVREDAYEYSGPVALACFGGASSAEKTINNQQQQMMSTLMSNYSQQFAGQQAILGNLQNAYGSILAAGPGQMGYTAPELAALRTQSAQGTAQAYQQAKQATGESLAAIGGGNTFLPSGTVAGINANLANSAAQANASNQLGITTAGYQQGLQNFNQAASVLGNVAQIQNPLGYAGATTSAGSSAFGGANTINQQNNAAQQALLGLAGGGVAGILGGINNLDTTGGSSGGEQAMNFLGGL